MRRRSPCAHTARGGSGSQSSPGTREDPPLSIAPPEQRETYCHECLTENPRTRRTCAKCGARLRHAREFADDVRDFTPSVSVRTFGNVGGIVLAMLAVAAMAILVPQWLGENPVPAGLVALAVYATGRFFGRLLARKLNEPTIN